MDFLLRILPLNLSNLLTSLFSRGSFAETSFATKATLEARNFATAALAAIYCTSSEVAHEARIRSTSGLVSRKERPQIAIAVVGMITTGDHEFGAIWSAQRTVRGAPDRVLIVRKEVRLIVTPGKIIYMTSTAADQTATFTSPKSVFCCKDDVTYSYRSWFQWIIEDKILQ